MLRNAHMGVCVWHVGSAVSIWRCEAKHNGNYSVGARDGSAVQLFGAERAASADSSDDAAASAPACLPVPVEVVEDVGGSFEDSRDGVACWGADASDLLPPSLSEPPPV
eukprot:2517811-Rhodomonas_salina.1